MPVGEPISMARVALFVVLPAVPRVNEPLTFNVPMLEPEASVSPGATTPPAFEELLFTVSGPTVEVVLLPLAKLALLVEFGATDTAEAAL